MRFLFNLAFALSDCQVRVKDRSRSEQACLARKDLGHTHLVHVLECVISTIKYRTC